MRAGRRAGAPARQLRRRRRTACSSPSTPRSTASRSASCRSPGPARSKRRQAGPDRPRAAGARRACGSSSRASSATATRCRPSSLTATFDASSILAALDARTSPTRDGARPDRRRDRRPRPDRPQASSASRPSSSAVAKRTLDSYFRDDGGQASGPGSSRSSSRITRRLDRRVRAAVPEGRRLPAAAAVRRVEPRRRRADLPRDRTPARAARSGCCRSCGRTRRSARPTTSSSRRPRPATTRPRATSTWSSQDSGWESKLAETLESMPEVVSYAKNQGLNFKIPYTYEGRAGNYVPDFLIRLRDAASTGDDDLLTLDPGGLRRGQEGEAGQGRDGRGPVGAGGQQLGRPRPLGVPRGHGSLGCGEPRRRPFPGQGPGGEVSGVIEPTPAQIREAQAGVASRGWERADAKSHLYRPIAMRDGADWVPCQHCGARRNPARWPLFFRVGDHAGELLWTCSTCKNAQATAEKMPSSSCRSPDSGEHMSPTWSVEPLAGGHFERLFWTENAKRDNFRSRLFGMFSEEIVRVWAQNDRAPYRYCGRPTLWRGSKYFTLDHLLERKSDGSLFAAEQKSELAWAAYSQLRLVSADQVRQHVGKPAFDWFAGSGTRSVQFNGQGGGAPCRSLWCGTRMGRDHISGAR